MFQLIKIEYGRDNVPEPQLLPAAEGTTYALGTALYVDSTSHTLKIATGDKAATHIALEDKTAKAGDKLLCYHILPQMLFEAPITAYNAATVVFGGKLQFSADGKGLTATAASTALGGVIVDTLGAAAAGDKLLVRLK